MKKTIITLVLSILLLSFITAEILTVAEKSNFRETSRYQDVMTFLFEMQKRSDKMNILTLTTSVEGRKIPLVVLSSERVKSPADLRLNGKPAVLINANIHAGEVEGKEAALMLIRDIVNHKIEKILDNQVILIIPIFNPDGNEKFGPNRRDNGPELAGVRYNGQHLDLNRDFLKVESPEVKALIKLFNQWDPVLFVDLHTTNGSYHREPVTYSTQTNPNTHNMLKNYMWETFFPQVAKRLKQYGFDSVPYGNFVDRFDPQKGWINWATAARFGFNYLGLRNRFAVLNENYSHADFKTRVLGCYAFIKSIVHFSNQNILNMYNLVKDADKNTKYQYYKSSFILESKTEKLFDLKLKSYQFEKEKIKPEDKHKYPAWFGDYVVKKTDKLVNYQLPYFSKTVAVKTISLPEAYIILPHRHQVVEKLKSHGLVVEKIRHSFKTQVEEFVFDEFKLAKRLYQGHVFLNCKIHTRKMEKLIPENSYFIPMRQSLARLIPVLLEPESKDSLLTWGFFNREIVSQWSGKISSYPVYRLVKIKDSIQLYQE